MKINYYILMGVCTSNCLTVSKSFLKNKYSLVLNKSMYSILFLKIFVMNHFGIMYDL